MYIRCLEAPDVLQEDGVQDLLLFAIGSFCNQNERRVLILDTNSSTFSVGVTAWFATCLQSCFHGQEFKAWLG